MNKKSLVETSKFQRSTRYQTLRYIFISIVGAILISFTVPFITHATSPITQGFSTTDTLSLGSIVSLKNNTSDQVVASSVSSTDSILGVVANGGNSLLSITNGQDDQVQIATSGTASVLVSDINGSISQGDQITASPIKGIGMKATSNTKVVGIAQGTLTGGSDSQQYYTDPDGKKQLITLGEVPILVNVSYYYKQPEKTLIPKALQDIANAIAGKTVDVLPIIISAAIFIVTLIVVVSIIFSMIRSSIISVGRNPMSQSAVNRSIIQISVLLLVILSVAVASIYLILTRL